MTIRGWKSLLTAIPLAAVLCACSDEPATRAVADCEAPAGTSPFIFESDGRELFGFIDAPETPGPHPAVLLIHDGGRTDVTRGAGDFAALRAGFREAGFASVVWDRAGSGCSGGGYGGIADLYARADDVVAAAEALQSTQLVDADRIGAWAIGEGGWVAPMAATRTDALKFLITVGAPGRDPIDRLLYLVEENLEREGYPKAEAAALTARLAEALEMMRDRAPYDAYQAAVEALAEHRLVPPLSEAGGDIFPTARRYEEIGDSAALHVSADVFLPALDIPVLAIWGERDRKVDWRESLEVYRNAFERSANSALTTKIITDADHAICEATSSEAPERRVEDTGGQAELRCELADGYLETMTAWLQAEAFPPTEADAPRQSRAVSNPADEGAR